MEEVLGTCVERGIKVVVNAGGLNPAGLRRRDAEAGDDARASRRTIAHIEGDDLLPRLPDAAGAAASSCATSTRASRWRRSSAQVVTANAYLGAWGIVEALGRGADVVICPRVTDAALALGPAAWKFGWARDDWDRLAAGIVAGHIIECGAAVHRRQLLLLQGGARHRPHRLPDRRDARRRHASSSPSTPAPAAWSRSARSRRSCSTRSRAPRYLNPDATARFDSIRLAQEGPDRVRVSGIKGEPPPPTTKVCINYLGGYRNSMTFVLAGLDIEAKARLAEETLWTLVGGRERFAETQRPPRALGPDRSARPTTTPSRTCR